MKPGEAVATRVRTGRGGAGQEGGGATKDSRPQRLTIPRVAILGFLASCRRNGGWRGDEKTGGGGGWGGEPEGGNERE